jgi:uncharacterized protein YodC (DUF2158 family)
LSDSGLYRCRASNFLQITNIFVVIFDRIVASQLSDSGLYRCRASNSLQITNIFVVIFDRIVASQLSDSGLYRCRASNSLGITLVEAAVTVVGKNAIIWFLDFTSTFSISTDQYFSL